MQKKGSVTDFWTRAAIGGLVCFAAVHAAHGAPVATTTMAPLSGFRGGAGFAAPSMAPMTSTMRAPGMIAPGGFSPARSPGFSPGMVVPARTMPATQWNTRPAFAPGTLPALNSNTLPALNSNTLPVLNGVNPRYINQPGVPGVPPGNIPQPPSVPGLPQPCPVPPVACPPGWTWWPWGWNGWVVWNGANFVVYWNGFPVPPYVPGPFGGLTYLYDPNLLPGATQRNMADQQNQAPAPPPPTAYEYGVMAFAVRQNDAAVRYLREAVAKDKEDTQAMRVLALALLEMRQPDDAAAMLRRAYHLDPTLAGRGLDVHELGLNSARRSSLINRAVEYANRVGSASAWLMVAVLMQADERHELARRMLKRAADEGLEPEVFGAMDAALTSRMRLPRQTP